MENVIIIASDEDAMSFLKKSLDGDFEGFNGKIELRGWPNFHMHINGEKYHQTITPSIMKGLLELQSGVYKSYALIHYNSDNSNFLTNDEKKELEFEVKVSDGSSELDIDLTDIATKFIEGTVGKMSATQAFILIGAFLLLYFGRSTYQLFLEKRLETRQAELDEQRSAGERSERLETITIFQEQNTQLVSTLIERAKLEDAKVATMQHHSNETKSAILKSIQNAESAEIQHAVELTGEAARELTVTPRSRWEPVRIDDWYRVLEVDSSNAASRKIRIQRVKDHKELITVLENDSLDQKNLQLIQKAEWLYAKIFLKLEALSLNGRYKEAKILGATNINESDDE